MANQLQLKRATNGTDLPMSNVSTALVGEPYFNTLTTVPGTAGDGDGNLYVADSASTFVHIGGSTYTARVDEFLTAFTVETGDGNADGANANIAITSQDITGSAVNLTVPSDLAASYTLTLPANDGDPSQVLQTNGSGVLTWVDQTSGFSGFDLDGDSGTAETIGNGQTVTIAGGLNVTTTVGATDTVTVALDQVLVDSNGNSVLDVTGGTGTAVNYIDINNAATGSGPEIAAVGTDTDIDLELLAKGTGVVTAGGIEVVTTSGTQTLTGKTFDANGTNNSLSNVEVADFAASAITTSGDTIASNDSDTQVPTSAAVIDYVGAQITAQDLDITDGTTTSAVDLDSQTLTIEGTGSEVEVGLSGQTFTVGLPNDVTVAGNLAVNGTTISTDETTGTFALLNTTLTGGINFGQAVTGTINIGSASSTVVTGNNLTVTGNLTVSGTTTTVNTQNVLVEDQNIVLGNVGSPDNTTANGGGITLNGGADGDKTITWVQGTAAWTLSEHLNLADTKEYRMNGTAVLDYDGSGNRILDNVIVDGGTY